VTNKAYSHFPYTPEQKKQKRNTAKKSTNRHQHYYTQTDVGGQAMSEELIHVQMSM